MKKNKLNCKNKDKIRMKQVNEKSIEKLKNCKEILAIVLIPLYFATVSLFDEKLCQIILIIVISILSIILTLTINKTIYRMNNENRNDNLNTDNKEK